MGIPDVTKHSHLSIDSLGFKRFVHTKGVSPWKLRIVIGIQALKANGFTPVVSGTGVPSATFMPSLAGYSGSGDGVSSR